MDFLPDSSFSEGVAGPCARLQASSSVVPLGSPVTATCEVREGCHLFSQGNLHLDWRLDDRLVLDSVVIHQSGLVSQIVIPNFNYTRGFLVCLAQGSSLQVVGGVQIKAGCMWDNFWLKTNVCASLLIQSAIDNWPLELTSKAPICFYLFHVFFLFIYLFICL